MGAGPESPRSAGERPRCSRAEFRGSAVTPGEMDLDNHMDSDIAAGRGGSGAGDRRNSLVGKDGVLLEEPHRRRAFSDSDGFRWSGGGRRSVAGRTFRGVSVGPRRTDGRLGYAGRFWRISQLDPRERAGTRQSIRSHAGVLAGWFSGYVLGSQEGRLERR